MQRNLGTVSWLHDSLPPSDIELVAIIQHRDGLKSLPVVRITSAEVRDWASKAAAVGAIVLSKPVEKDHLIHEIRVGLHAGAA